MIRNRFTPLILILVAVCATGCINRTQALSDAALPIGTQINADMTTYIAQQEPGELQALQTMTNQRYLLACQSGDYAGVVATWYGNNGEGIRYWYVNYLHTDPLYDEPWGADVRNMKLRNVTVFDYLLTIGNPPAPPPG